MMHGGVLRTTINLDDAVLEDAKHRAVDLGISLSQFVERAVRDALAEGRPVCEGKFSMPVAGDPRAVVRHEPRDFWAATEADDEAGLR